MLLHTGAYGHRKGVKQQLTVADILAEEDWGRLRVSSCVCIRYNSVNLHAKTLYLGKARVLARGD